MVEKNMNRMADFPLAPQNWSLEKANNAAESLGIVMGPEHWEIVLCLQEYFSKNDNYNRRELTDALEEFWYAQGGLKALYLLFPGGPIAQGCEIAGLPVPAGTVDRSFGSTS